MELTKDNFTLYAMHYYDNPTCITEEEFYSDLQQLRTIRRMVSRYLGGEELNLRLLVNNLIIFYNCFEHHAATKMIQLTVDESDFAFYNAILQFLSLPMLIPPHNIDEQFYKQLEEEFS